MMGATITLGTDPGVAVTARVYTTPAVGIRVDVEDRSYISTPALLAEAGERFRRPVHHATLASLQRVGKIRPAFRLPQPMGRPVNMWRRDETIAALAAYFERADARRKRSEASDE